MDPIVITVVVAYLAVMLGIGYWSARQIKDSDDFLLAGRRLGPVMLAGALAATEVGGGSSLGVTEKAYGQWGLSALWYVVTMAITFVIMSFLAPLFRRQMVRTIPEYFYKRYGNVNGILTAVIMILPMIGLTAIQLMASATVLSVMTGMSYVPAVLIVTFVVTVYSIVGGLWSVTLTDFVQWILIVVGSALVIPYALDAGGGWQAIREHVPDAKMSLTDGIGFETIASLTIMYTASFCVGQEAIQRLYAARDEKAARQGALLAGAVYVLYAFIPAILGILAFGLVDMGVVDSTAIENNGTRYVLPTLASEVLPPAMVGLLFAALISATLSSADSDLLAAGSIFSNDIYRKHIRKDASEDQVLKVTRWTMVAVAVFSLAVALLNAEEMITILMFSFALRAGGAFIPYVLGHFMKRPNATSSLAALITGSAVVIVGNQGWVPLAGIDPVVPALVVSLIAYLTAHRLRPTPET